MSTLLKDVATGGSATATACIFTNPLEVIKTRLQLQGEMAASASAVRYTGVADTAVKMVRHEGVMSLQKGLVPGMIYQIFMNGTRLGTYPSLKRVLRYDDSETVANFARGLCAGAISGGMGAVIGSPFFMVKCRLQAQSSAGGVDGFQHNYKGMTDGLLQVLLAHYMPSSCSCFPHAAVNLLPTEFFGPLVPSSGFSWTTGVQVRGCGWLVQGRRWCCS